jgi:hypothetical protein
VVRKGGPDFVPPPERIAVFDNDGTLWAEQPIYVQLAFAFDRVKALAPQHPEWQEKEPFASLLKGDVNAALAGGQRAILEIVMATHAGMTTEEFERAVKEWTTTAKHPKTGRLYTEMVYQPMLYSHIGRRPIAAFGNSDGDQQMLEWTQAGAGTRLMMLVRHDDAAREWAYDAQSKIGTFSDALLALAKQNGWSVISMKTDWRRIFPFERK